jgi:hypothetical protein
MEDNNEIAHAELYLSTCEKLAGHAYQATAKQQQLNILAQAVTVDNTKILYTISLDYNG